VVAVERQLSDLAGDIQKARAGRAAAEAALAEATSRYHVLEREQRSSVLAELAAARAERDQLSEAHRRQAATLRNLIVRAPVDGIVQDIMVTSPGQSVGSNQPLMKLVPTGGGLVVEARVRNQDIGHVGVGQSVKVKVHAYDFLRYGTLSGRIEQIDADAVVDPKSGALTYGVVVRTDGAALARNGIEVKVVPGMAVDLDLLVGAGRRSLRARPSAPHPRGRPCGRSGRCCRRPRALPGIHGRSGRARSHRCAVA
jgi:HlyD family type I secretion membrane fusion protein